MPDARAPSGNDAIGLSYLLDELERRKGEINELLRTLEADLAHINSEVKNKKGLA
jgi:hypothetical protein